jgi:hypothetical protein
MPGNLSLAFAREPSYLRACRLCGPPRDVLAAAVGDDIVALCSHFSWSYWVEGKPTEIWTVGDFRALDAAAHRGVTGQGWSALRQRLVGRPAIMSVVDDNVVATRLFSKVRSGWPRLSPVAELKTLIFPVIGAASGTPMGLVRPRSHMLVDLLNSRRRGSDLVPVVGEEHFGSELPPLEDFVAVSDGSGLLACGACWCPRDYRQIVVADYQGSYAKAYRWAERLRWSLLPQPGSEIPAAFACFVTGDDPEALEAVMRALMQKARQRESHFLVWGGDAQRACPAPKHWFRFSYGSKLFQLLWDDEKPLSCSGSSEFEVAWL